MRYCRTILLVMMLACNAFSQTFEWAKVRPLPLTSSWSAVRSTLALDSSDNPVYGRLSLSVTGEFGEYVIEKLNSAGATLFSDTLFGKVSLRHIAVDGSNNVIAAGLFRDTIVIDSAMLTIPPGSTTNAFLLKIRHDGRLVWLKNMTQRDATYKEIFSLKTDAENNLWAAVSPGFPTSYVKKLDSEGNEIASFPQINARVISSIAIDAKGYVWAAGSTFDGNHSFNGFVTNAPYTYNFYVVRYSPAGVVSWVQFVQDITLSHPLLAKAGCDMIMGGNLLAATTFGTLPAHGPHWVYDLYATRLDSGGTFVWLREVPQGTGAGDAGSGNGSFLVAENNGSAIATGFTRGSVNWGNGVVTQARSANDVLVISYSTVDGTVQWAKTAGGDFYNRGDAVAIDRQSAIYIAGTVGTDARFDSLQFTGGSINTFIAKIRPPGVLSVKENSPLADFFLHQNYPNPFNPSTTIGFRIIEDGVVTLKLYDMLGREVRTLLDARLEAGEYQSRLDAEGLAGGVYICRLQSGTSIRTRKLMLLR